MSENQEDKNSRGTIKAPLDFVERVRDRARVIRKAKKLSADPAAWTVLNQALDFWEASLNDQSADKTKVLDQPHQKFGVSGMDKREAAKYTSAVEQHYHEILTKAFPVRDTDPIARAVMSTLEAFGEGGAPSRAVSAIGSGGGEEEGGKAAKAGKSPKGPGGSR